MKHFLTHSIPIYVYKEKVLETKVDFTAVVYCSILSYTLSEIVDNKAKIVQTKMKQVETSKFVRLRTVQQIPCLDSTVNLIFL